MKTTSFYKIAATSLALLGGIIVYDQVSSEPEQTVAVQKIDTKETAGLQSILQQQAPAANASADASKTAREITAEIEKAFNGQPSLPLLTYAAGADNMDGLTPDLLLERVAQGEHILVSWKLDPYYSFATDDSYYENSIATAADLGLPIVFNVDALESALLSDSYFTAAADSDNPAVISKDGTVSEQLSPFAPDSVWYEAGKRWAQRTILTKIQAWYPRPPLVIFISENAANKLPWEEAAKDFRFPTRFGSDLDENTVRTFINASWVEKFRQLHLGFTEALQQSAWAKNTKFISADQLSADMGINESWMNRATITNRIVNVWPMTSDGLNLDFSLEDDESIARSPYIEANNLSYMLKDAQLEKPTFVSMLTLNDDNRINTLENYQGFAQFAMWFLRPDIITKKDNAYDPVLGGYFFDTLADAVESIYDNATLQEYWLNGVLLPNGDSPFNLNVPETLLDAPRWYLLDSSANFTQDWTSSADISLWAFALELQSKARNKSSETLLFTNSTYGDRNGVDVTVPGYGDVMVDASEEGTFTTLTGSTSTVISSAMSSDMSSSSSPSETSSAATSSLSSDAQSSVSSAAASEGPASSVSSLAVSSSAPISSAAASEGPASSASSLAVSSSVSISSATVVESSSSSISSTMSSSSASSLAVSSSAPISSAAASKGPASSTSSLAVSSSVSISSATVVESSSSSISSTMSSSSVSSSSSESIVSFPECQTGPATQEGTVFDSATGKPVANVSVSIAGCSTTTDEQGHYSLNNIAINDKAAVNFTLDGYFPNTAIIQVEQYNEGTTQLSSNYLEFFIGKYALWNPWSFESETGASGGAVIVPASSCLYPDGTNYQGTVEGYWIFTDTTTKNGRDLLPGQYEGKNLDGEIVPFVSYGFMSLEMKDGSGTTLDVSENITLVLTSVSGTTATSIPLWYFDYESGTWNEQGSAIRRDDGSYIATVAHPGTWSLSLPLKKAPGIYRGNIAFEDGTAAKDIRVYALGANWISSDLSTDAGGNFELKVIPDSSFELKAYNYKDKYEAVYSGTIPAIASGEIAQEEN